MTQQTPLWAREYRRLSDAKGGTSIDDQGADNGDAAEDQGWKLGEPYIDDGLSASRYARRKRDDFEQLVGDLQSGPTGRESRFGADILMLWESSRGSRRVGEWVTFIELCEDKGVKIWVTTHERLYDPANGRDRKALIDDANDSEYESYKTSRRVSRTTPKEARKGRPHGEAPYGLMPVYDERTGKLITWVEDPKRSMVPKLLFERLEAGHSFAAIERLFLESGYLNRSGRPFTHGHLRRMAIMHSYAGLRHHNGALYEGVWDALVPVERFWNVYALVTDPSRVTYRGGGTRHELTAALKCSRCDVHPSVRSAPGRQPVYRCAKCGMKIQKAQVDDLVIGSDLEHSDGSVERRPGVLLVYLARSDIYQLLTQPASDDGELADVRAQLARSRTERDEFRRAKAKNVSEALIIANSLEEKNREVDELETRERELSVPASVLRFLRPGTDVWDSWHEAPVSARRVLVRAIMRPDLLGVPYVLPSPTRGRYQPIAERIEWRH
ncbi:recombinase family protein [Streptomyces sp. NPDC059759]|uniref:recombinase family protein n=1 Tax=unclassified Streptomyces TaxID=2593676 RepID=UPI0036655164